MNQDNFKQNGHQVNDFNPKEERNKLSPRDKKILTQFGMLTRSVTKDMEEFQYAKAAERLYEYIWHQLADHYIEGSKEKLQQYDEITLSILNYIFITCLKLLHPFMPFITEEIADQIAFKKSDPLIISAWPRV